MGSGPEICRRHYAAHVPEEMGDSVGFAAPLHKPEPPQARSA
jgi:hypothetical protein